MAPGWSVISPGSGMNAHAFASGNTAAPVEVMRVIAEFVVPDIMSSWKYSIKPLLTVSKSFTSIVIPILFRHITFTSPRHLLRLYRFLTEPALASYDHIQTLTITDIPDLGPGYLADLGEAVEVLSGRLKGSLGRRLMQGVEQGRMVSGELKMGRGREWYEAPGEEGTGGMALPWRPEKGERFEIVRSHQFFEKMFEYCFPFPSLSITVDPTSRSPTTHSGRAKTLHLSGPLEYLSTTILRLRNTSWYDWGASGIHTSHFSIHITDSFAHPPRPFVPPYLVDPEEMARVREMFRTSLNVMELMAESDGARRVTVDCEAEPHVFCAGGMGQLAGFARGARIRYKRCPGGCVGV